MQLRGGFHISQTKKELKAHRIKSYFIEAAKNIILSEGVDHVTVRKIADKSGYSYGTIYNYYTDLDELLGAVKSEIISDIAGYMGAYVENKMYTLGDIKAMNKKFIDYFLENRNVYDFLYHYHLDAKSPSMFDNTEIGEASWSTYDGLVKEGVIRHEDVPVIAKTMIYCFYGLLSLYFSSNGVSKRHVYEGLEQMSDYILSPRLQR